ncbi:MAG: glycosyltransferase family 61 protein [Nocardioides sp.]|nr:glycosyltransferase family 61 protein [Nocardioides sp.]
MSELEGTWCHLDNELRGHFGHAMTEQLSRMWAWEQVKERFPEAKALVTLNKGRYIKPWEAELYEAAGIGRDDMVLLDHPARVEHLISPGPMFSNPNYVHPAIAKTWRKVGDSLAAGATRTEFSDRIFCSRTIEKRSCHNREEVEQLFADRGFEIVFPEEHSVADQVQMFRHADVVAGFAGSGLFQLALVGAPKHVVIVASDRYTARNEYLMASVLGHSIDQVTCRPDEPHFQSDFTFDHMREGQWLAKVLEAL